MTISIGICAYNEEHSIGKLLIQIIKQKFSFGKLEKILVVSDGSSDNTIKVAKAIPDKSIKVIADSERKGKSIQLNRIFQEINSDLLILLDADITLAENALNNLLSAFKKDPSLSLASGIITPSKPETFTQKALFAGFELMDQAKKEVDNNDAYSCTGAIRAMKKSFYKQIRFPSVTAEDIYPFFYCMAEGKKYLTVKEAVVNFHLPASYGDYLKQMRRYLSSPFEHKQLFSEKLTNKYFTITTFIKLKALITRLRINPFWTVIYLIYLTLPKILVISVPYKTQSTWMFAK